MPNRHQERMFRQVNGPWADMLQGRTHRRVLVVATIAAIASMATAMPYVADRFWVLVATGLAFGAFAILLNLSLRGVFELKDELLDECQIAMRNRAYKAAYGFTIVFTVIAATTGAGLALQRQPAFSLAAFTFFVCVMAPRLYVAWVKDDDDAGE